MLGHPTPIASPTVFTGQMYPRQKSGCKSARRQLELAGQSCLVYLCFATHQVDPRLHPFLKIPKSQAVFSPCRTITRGRSYWRCSFTPCCALILFCVPSAGHTHTTHTQNMYLDVYVHVHLVTPSIWMVFHFWGLKRMTSKLAGCNRKEPKIPKEKCNAVVRFKD